MIQLAPNRILIHGSGPTPFLFDVDSLHDRLTASFQACGINGAWMADDILMAVHGYVNNSQQFVDGEQRLEQLHSSLIKVLQDNGFPEVAAHFSQSLQNNSLDALTAQIAEELGRLVPVVNPVLQEQVLQKLLSLGYDPEKITGLLIREICQMELSSGYRRQEQSTVPHHSQLMPFDSKYVNWNWDFLNLVAAGNLFNSIRVNIYPCKLAASLEMETFLEMIFMKEWQLLLAKSCSYLETCLYHLKEVSQIDIDYISVVTHDIDDLKEYCELADTVALQEELNQSIEVAFGRVLAKFSKISFIQK